MLQVGLGILSDGLNTHFVRAQVCGGTLSLRSAAVTQEKHGWGWGEGWQPNHAAAGSPPTDVFPASKAARNEVPEGSVGPHFLGHKKTLGDLSVWAAHRTAPDCRALLLSVGFTCGHFLCWSEGLGENEAQ